MPGLGEWLFGSNAKLKKFDQFSPEQQDFFKQLFGQLQGLSGQGGGFNQATNLLQDYLNPQSDVYKNFEAPYRQEFEQQTLPGIANRYAGLNAMGGGLSSSGFGQALGAAGSQLQTNLAGMKSQLQRQSINDILGQYNQMSNLGLNAQPFGYQKFDASQGFLGPAAVAAAGAAGKAYGSKF